MKINKWLIAILLFFVIGFSVFTAVFFFTGGNIGTRGVREVSSSQDIKTVIIPTSSKFQTNLKGSKSIISVNYQIEVVEDKRLFPTMEERDPEARSKVLNILRDKTTEDVNGTEGKKELEQQILQCYQLLFGQDKIISIYIDDIVIQ